MAPKARGNRNRAEPQCMVDQRDRGVNEGTPLSCLCLTVTYQCCAERGGQEDALAVQAALSKLPSPGWLHRQDANTSVDGLRWWSVRGPSPSSC
eukprot:1149962-Pelagomonas_calceolata.AAC.1